MLESIDMETINGDLKYIKDLAYFKGESIINNGDSSYLKKNSLIEFKPGLNIITGSNGSGKTSILTAIANYFLANEYSGPSTIDINTLIDHNSKIENTVIIKGDRYPIYYFTPDITYGVCKGNQFADDLYTTAIENTIALNNRSTGESTLIKLMDIIESFRVKEVIEIKPNITVKLDKLNDISKDTFKKLMERISDKIVNPQTILMDEPERGVPLIGQKKIFNLINKNKDKYQFIISTHSPLAFNIEGANYIDLNTEEYRSITLDICRNL